MNSTQLLWQCSNVVPSLTKAAKIEGGGKNLIYVSKCQNSWPQGRNHRFLLSDQGKGHGIFWPIILRYSQVFKFLASGVMDHSEKIVLNGTIST